MLEILKKVTYIYLIVIGNLYVCSYIKNKISARAEMRRGYVMGRAAGLGYPFVKTFKFLSKDYRINVFEIILFFFAFFMWTVIPFSQTLVLVKFDADLLVAMILYFLLIFLILVNSSRSNYGFIFINFSRKVLMVFGFFIPVIFSIAGIILITRTLNLREIVGFQFQYWNIIYQPLGFIVIFTSAFLQFKLFGIARTNSIVFSENTDKEGQGFGRLVTRTAYYCSIFFMIILMVILYLAGWQNFYFVDGNILFVIKFYIIFFIILLIDRATPKLNDYHYLLTIAWKFLLPIAAVNFIMTLIFFILRNIYNII